MNPKDITLWTAIVSPMNEDGSLDFESLNTLLRRQEEAGNGVVLLGSTGEGLALNLEDKKAFVEFATSQNFNIPFMVGVGGFDLDSNLEWIKYLEQNDKVTSYLMPTPLYAKPGVLGQIAWFEALLNASTKPCMLYNIPSRSGIKLHQEVIRELKGHPNLWALKDASGSISELQAYREASENLKVYSGEDALLPQQAPYGIAGLVSVSSNVWPKATAAYVNKCLNLELSGLYPTWDKAVDALFRASNPIPAKVLLHQKSLIKTPTLRAPLTHLELVDARELMEADKNINQWRNNNGL
jgi:4-hydroxy-tetrahydrodipicolinate synthase